MDIDASLVRELVARQFPNWAGLPVQPVAKSGWDNRTFHLGSEMCVRLPSHQRYAPQVEKEHKWLPTLAPHLSLAIPKPLELGRPGAGYPWHWSIYQWIEGEAASEGGIEDVSQFARVLADFLESLRKIDATDGPAPGPHNFFRGGPLTVYDTETRDAIAVLRDALDSEAVSAVWEAALGAHLSGDPVWVHGDVSPSNLLVSRGRLSAVIDFGCSGVGDPACDLTIAWTFFSGSGRDAFKDGLSLDADTWARARGWALWKGLIMLAPLVGTDHPDARAIVQVIEAVIEDHRSAAE